MQGNFDPENPGNPGSENHPSACKPCNKFNPGRPLDSCKHGSSCEFCHCSHERPKHRGQRGRHALQRRQYLESRDEQPIEFRELVDHIYQVPHQALDEVKKRLTAMPPRDREEKVMAVLEMIRVIGELAQHSRPDSSRLRGARIVTAEGMSALSELDGRCKWLVGTLHLMVRKMWDAKEPFPKMEDTVRKILDECRRLPEALDKPFDPGPFKDSLQVMGSSTNPHYWITREYKLDSQSAWLQDTVLELALETLKKGAEQEDVAKTLSSIRDATVLDRTQLTDGLQAFLLNSNSLQDLAASIIKIGEKYTELLMEADCLEDCNVKIDLRDIQSSASLQDPSASSATAAFTPTMHDEIDWNNKLNKHRCITEEIEVALQKKLPHACRFLEKSIRSQAQKEVESGEPCENIEETLHKILEECMKLPRLMDNWVSPPPGMMRLFSSAEEVEHIVSLKLFPSDNLEHVLVKLHEMIYKEE